MMQKKQRFSAECEAIILKKSILNILLSLLFLIAFNTVFFLVLGLEHPISVWISYGCIHFAYLMLIANSLFTRKSSQAHLFGASLYVISKAYFLIELVVGIFFILLSLDGFKLALIIQLLLAIVYLAAFLTCMLANEHTADSVERRENEVAYIKTAATRVKLLMDKSSDKNANREIEKVYDALHSSPTRSIPLVRNIESTITDRISDLERAVRADSVSDIISVSKHILSLIDERNVRLRLNQ